MLAIPCIFIAYFECAVYQGGEGDSEQEPPLYRTDEFRIFCMKVRPSPPGRAHRNVRLQASSASVNLPLEARSYIVAAELAEADWACDLPIFLEIRPADLTS